MPGSSNPAGLPGRGGAAGGFGPGAGGPGAAGRPGAGGPGMAGGMAGAQGGSLLVEELACFGAALFGVAHRPEDRGCRSGQV